MENRGVKYINEIGIQGWRRKARNRGECQRQYTPNKYGNHPNKNMNIVFVKTAFRGLVIIIQVISIEYKYDVGAPEDSY